MQTDHVEDGVPRGRQPGGTPTADVSPGIDPATFAVLSALLALPLDTARHVREATPRRRPRRPQHGPTADLGEPATES